MGVTARCLRRRRRARKSIDTRPRWKQKGKSHSSETKTALTAATLAAEYRMASTRAMDTMRAGDLRERGDGDDVSGRAEAGVGTRLMVQVVVGDDVYAVVEFRI